MGKKATRTSFNGQVRGAKDTTAILDFTAVPDSTPPTPARVPEDVNRPQPLPTIQPKRKIDLAHAMLPDPGALQTVESLCVRELKGVGAMFTPNLSGILMFMGLVYKPQGEYEAQYQIIIDQLMTDPRVMRYAKRIVFTPVYNWSMFEMILLPVKLTTFGRRVLDDLQKLQPRFPHFKAFIEWDGTRKRHMVRWDTLTEQEQGIIVTVKWPAREDILDALSATAYDDLETLAEANDDIRTLLRSHEVE
jgi:hypothetical protein